MIVEIHHYRHLQVRPSPIQISKVVLKYEVAKVSISHITPVSVQSSLRKYLSSNFSIRALHMAQSDYISLTI